MATPPTDRDSIGYVSDVPYRWAYQRELTPLWLYLCQLSAGAVGADPLKPFTSIDLGCGYGVSITLLAAANPHGRFVGVDFLPEHISGARRLADEAGVTNVTFIEASFDALDRFDLPQFDIATLHGVWSWVPAPVRETIVRFLQAKLKSGGALYVGYNSEPGWTSIAPLRRLMNRFAATVPGTSADRLAASLAFLRGLRDAGGAYFTNNPQASQWLDELEKKDPAYLIHEYLTPNWNVFDPQLVSAEFAPAGLTLVGQATLAAQIEALAIPQAAQAAYRALRDPALRMAFGDFLVDQRFRRDLFMRNPVRPTRDTFFAAVRGLWFGLIRPRAACPLAVSKPKLEMQLDAWLYDPILDALANGVQSVAALEARLAPAGISIERLLPALILLTEVDYVLPALSPDLAAAALPGTTRFNAVAARLGRDGRPIPLASPVFGSAFQLAPPELSLAGNCLLDGAPTGMPAGLHQALRAASIL
jgi:SAM-dependent methyltransferase